MATLTRTALCAGLDRYRVVLTHPGGPDGVSPSGFFVPGVVARLGVAMTGLGLLLAIEDATHSYSRAGVATAVFALTEAVVGPQLARLVDRFGQRSIVLIAVGVHVLSVLTAVLAARTAPFPLVVGSVAIAGAVVPQPGALTAARWVHIVDGRDALRTALSLEAGVNDVVFLAGPLAVISLTAVATSYAGSVAAAACLLLGCVGITAHRPSAPTPHLTTSRGGGRAPLMSPRFVGLLGVNAGLGCFFGAVPVLVTAVAHQAGRPSLAGIILASSSAASLVSGITYGALRRAPGPQKTQLAASAVLVLAVVIGAVRPTLGGFTVMLIIGGSAIAPLVASSAHLVSHGVPERARTQGFTWINTASAVGIAGAAALTGTAIQHSGIPTAALVLPPLVTIAVVSAATMVAGARTVADTDAAGTPGSGLRP